MQEISVREMAWMDKAACSGTDSKLFFPSHTNEESGPSGPNSYKAARAICAECEVTETCLLYALKHFPHVDDDHGMWGGMTPRERRKYKKLHRGSRFITPPKATA